MKVAQLLLNNDRKVSLDIYLQDVEGALVKSKKRPGILILPGGAYDHHDLKEADNIAFAYLKAGFQAFVLKYSVKENASWPNPLNDYNEAMKYLNDNSNDLCLDVTRIAVIGFSAGGHLAMAASVMGDIRPRATILGYPALIKETIGTLHKNIILPLDKDDENVPPVFIFQTRTDEMVNIKNSLELQEYLWKNNINFESHIHSFGDHGFGLGDNTSVRADISIRAKNWFDDSLSWLDEVWGKFSRDGFGKPKYTNRINDDKLGCLTCNCTIKRIKENIEGLNILKELFNEDLNPLFENIKLSSVLAYMGKVDLIDELNEKLRDLK